jgi:organic radical activating enzyme
MNKQFPIKSNTACLLKWSWSTVFLSLASSSSCHRCDHDIFKVGEFHTFHNTPRKVLSREMMRRGEWPQAGCQYCQTIEQSGGMSDRQYQLTNGHYEHATELDQDASLNEVTPTILEMYFTNVCNMSCLYCGPHFSSKWEEENRKFGLFEHGTVKLLPEDTRMTSNYNELLEEFWIWFKQNHLKLRYFHVLGGEPFYQKELELCLDFFDANPSPDLTLNLVSNLKVEPRRFARTIDRMMSLKDAGKLKRIQITGSLDCWGPQQEYVRWGLDLNEYTANMEYMLTKDITLCINAAVNALSIKTMPEYFEKINYWNQLKKDLGFQWDYINWSCTSVPSPSHMKPDIFGPEVFRDDIARILDVMPEDNEQQINIKEHFKGIAAKIMSRPKNPEAIENLKIYLDEIDRRRNTNWKILFPWLLDQ